MKNIARMSAEDRGDLIQLVARELKRPNAVVEKDFWVCYTLNHLFHYCRFKDSIIFKGGTSLSKAYGLIDRFSEDIDLILDWRLLDYGIDEPWAERSHNGQDKFCREAVQKTDAFLLDKFMPALSESMEVELGYPVKIYPAAEGTVIFEYPRNFSSGATLDIIRLETGPLAAWTPSEIVTITSNLAEARPNLFDSASTQIATAKPERTFWEKATILHQEAHRAEDKKIPPRYSRHYYDLYRLGHSYVKTAAYSKLDLLRRVVAFKEKFYRTPWAHLDLAVPGTLKLVPPGYRLAELSDDYDVMQEMFTGSFPSFTEIIKYLAILEDEINVLK